MSVIYQQLAKLRSNEKLKRRGEKPPKRKLIDLRPTRWERLKNYFSRPSLMMISVIALIIGLCATFGLYLLSDSPEEFARMMNNVRIMTFR